MKVLHLPVNTASQMSVTVRALRDIGIDARGIVFNNLPEQCGAGLEVFSPSPIRRHPVCKKLYRIPFAFKVLSAIRWADVIHWHFRSRAIPKDLDLKFIAFLNKARIVEFWGTDIRIPEIASADNPYMAKMYEDHPELADGAREKSLKAQSRFARYGFKCLLPGVGMESFIEKSLFPSPYRTAQRILLSEFDPSYPDPQKPRPMIVHAPSHKAKKGTKAVLQTIEHLKHKYEFDFELLHAVNHSKAIEILHNCDIMVDQFFAGCYGLAALEAMAFGKPTVCYIKPSLASKYPDDLPIVNANQENLTEVIESLLVDGQRRYEIGRRSRAYVEKYHDAHKIARDLVVVYEELLKNV
ncbi:MAG: glycosyltransferase [Planctomycetota bacterium]|jgi:hypothetical protein